MGVYFDENERKGEDGSAYDSSYTYVPPKSFYNPSPLNSKDSELKKLLLICGLSPIIYLAVSFLCSLLYFAIHSFVIHYLGGTRIIFYFRNIIYPFLETIFSFVCLLVPFLCLLIWKNLYGRKGKSFKFVSIKPFSFLDSFGFLSLGFVGVYAGSYLTGITTMVAENFGIVLLEKEYVIPEHPVGVFFTFVSIALIAGIFEELLFRGAILSCLRRYGDMFSVVVSSFLFAVLHRNLIQMPYTFALGFIMGLIVVKTDNIFYSMLIHIVNNTLAFVGLLLEKIGNQAALTIFNSAYSAVVMLLGIFGAVYYIVKYKKSSFSFSKGDASSLRKNPYFLAIACPTVIVAFIICAFQTLEYVSFSWG